MRSIGLQSCGFLPGHGARCALHPPQYLVYESANADWRMLRAITLLRPKLSTLSGYNHADSIASPQFIQALDHTVKNFPQYHVTSIIGLHKSDLLFECLPS